MSDDSVILLLVFMGVFSTTANHVAVWLAAHLERVRFPDGTAWWGGGLPVVRAWGLLAVAVAVVTPGSVVISYAGAGDVDLLLPFLVGVSTGGWLLVARAVTPSVVRRGRRP